MAKLEPVTVVVEGKLHIQTGGDITLARLAIEMLIKDLRGDNPRGGTREQSLALTKLEEAYLWLGEDLRRN